MSTQGPCCSCVEIELPSETLNVFQVTGLLLDRLSSACGLQLGGVEMGSRTENSRVGRAAAAFAGILVPIIKQHGEYHMRQNCSIENTATWDTAKLYLP